MKAWKEASLTDLGTIERGRSRHRPRNDPRLFGPGLPFFQTGDVKAATLHMTRATQEYSEFGVAQSRVWQPGTTCITIAANIAESAVLGVRGCFPDSVLGFVPADQDDDAYFVKYLLDVHRERLTNSARGTTQDNLSLEKLLSHSFPIPEPIERSRIAGVLRSIDELIENNRQRVELLERTAQAVYGEWFVHFRYPGHEDVPLVDSPLGPMPNGWDIATVGDTFEVVLGGTPSRKKLEYWTAGTVPWVTSTRVNDVRVLEPSELITREALDSCNAKLMPRRTTLIAITGATLGQVSALEIEACANQSVVGVFDPGGTFAEYVYLWFSKNIESVISHASGSAQQHINKGTVSSTRLPLPARGVIDEFKTCVEPTFSLVADLMFTQSRLAAMRDLLLPKLVTGQIDVSHLDLDVLTEAASA